MDRYYKTRMARNIALKSDTELLEIISNHKNDYSVIALKIIEDEIDKRKAYYEKLQKLKARAREFAKDMVTAETDLEGIGFRELKDPYRFLHILWQGLMGLFFAFVATIYLLNEFDYEIPPIFNSIIIYTVILGFSVVSYYMYKRRRCPVCRKKMIELKPSEHNYESTYKYICYPCQSFVNTIRKRHDGTNVF